MKLLLALLRRFLRLGAEGEDDPDTTATTGGAPGAGENDDTAPAAGAAPASDTLDDILDLDEPTGTPSATPGSDWQQRAERAERELETFRRGASAPPAPAPAGGDADYAREEQQIAQARANGATDEQLRWLQWQIDSNRTMRASRRESQEALARANDLNDKVQFDQLAISKPALHKRYAPRVEEIIADLRNKGQIVPPRSVLIRALIGDDMINGKLKTKPRQAAAPTAEPTNQPQGNVQRQRLPNARSDVSARSGQTERDKRRARLENVQL